MPLRAVGATHVAGAVAPPPEGATPAVKSSFHLEISQGPTPDLRKFGRARVSKRLKSKGKDGRSLYLSRAESLTLFYHSRAKNLKILYPLETKSIPGGFWNPVITK